MKKLFLLLAVAFLTAVSAEAQGLNGTRNAIGIRGGWGAEISYQRYVAPANRIEATLGWNRYGFDMSGIYQWMFKINSDVPGQFKWYAGPGVGIGSWSSKKFDKGFSFGFLGQVGVEYTFDSIPLLLSLDYRPGIFLTPETHFDWSGFGLGIRYCF